MVPTLRRRRPRVFRKGTHLGEAAPHAGFAREGCLGVAGGARRVLQEVLFQGGRMGREFVGLAFPGRRRIRPQPPSANPSRQRRAPRRETSARRAMSWWVKPWLLSPETSLFCWARGWGWW